MGGLIGDGKRLVEGVLAGTHGAALSHLRQFATDVELFVVYLDTDELDFHFNDRTRHDGFFDGASRDNCKGLAPVIPTSARRAFGSHMGQPNLLLGRVRD